MEKEYTANTDIDFVSEAELAHWGIKGMKWGIRRYQYKDGSLTPAGRKRYAQLESEIAKLKPKGERSETETEVAARQKSVNEMSNEELRARTERMRIESDYYNAARNLATTNPKKVSAGKRFMNSLVNDVIAPAAKNAGRAWAEDFMKTKLGLNKKDVDPLKKEADNLKKLENKYKKLEWEQKIDRIKNKDADDDLTWDERQKKQTWLKGRVEELENLKDVEYYEKHGKLRERDNKPASNNSNNSSNKPDNKPSNNNKPDNKPSNNNSGNNNKSSDNSSNSGNNKSNNDKKNKGWDDTYDKTFNIKVEEWDYNSPATQKKVDRMLSDLDNKYWDEFIRNY